MRILITGGCGFVGSNLAIKIKEKNNSYQIICLDNLKRRGSELNISRLKASDINFIHGDIRIKSDIENVGPVDMIIDAAAEPSVLAGINESPDYVIDTNFSGTINCLNYALKNNAGIIFLSTSRIYPVANLEKCNFIETESRYEWTDNQSLQGISSKGVSEAFPLQGSRSIYGATKLASELFAEEYNALLNVKTVINRCGVISGPFQMGKVDQGVVVLWAARHFWKKELSYIGYGGEGKQVRDILHIDDLFKLVDWQIHHIDSVNGQVFNVGGGITHSLSLLEMTALCEEISNNKISILKVPETRVADLRIYITDNSKVSAMTGWSPEITVKQTLTEIFDWIKRDENLLNRIFN